VDGNYPDSVTGVFMTWYIRRSLIMAWFVHGQNKLGEKITKLIDNSFNV
jgi:hypothetical protein